MEEPQQQSPKLDLSDGIVVIGMDPSSYRNCGWSVVRFKNGKPELLAKFTQVLTRPEADFGRLRDVYDSLQKTIQDHKALVLCVERSMGGGLMFVRNNLSETVGAAKLCCHDNQVKVHEISPSHLKKVIAGHGKAKKRHIKANIVATFGLDKAGPEHECDATAFALCYLIDAGWTGYEIKVPFSKNPKPMSGALVIKGKVPSSKPPKSRTGKQGDQDVPNPKDKVQAG